MARRWGLFFFLPLLLLLLLSCSCIISHALPCCSGKQTAHDDLNPEQATNPTMPITVPSTNPAPIIITVPSTNPTITIPSLNPLPTPITAPSMVNPSTSPAPAAYPLPTPSTSPPSASLTNPTSNPMTPAISMPPPALTTTPPTAPGLSGQQLWCVAKADSADIALQNALDYACGIGGADCLAIQPSGTCYYPNTLGSGSCVLASSMSLPSSSVSGYNPALTTPTASSTITPTTLSGSGPSVLNPDGSGSASSSEFGSDIPATSNSWRSISPNGWSLAASFSMLAWAYMMKGTILETE
ncbi:pectinesterase inhibitor 10-like isoform X4 [Oryza sativa Japonica Group]|uniref:pectinesterase inhibitor 10-like isoform X4 n=1 Tax=Oryza sativa subsp. japonica TaxID=39947 RepID=UPI00339BF8A2